jgi:uncharacterized protein (DUF433 family)
MGVLGCPLDEAPLQLPGESCEDCHEEKPSGFHLLAFAAKVFKRFEISLVKGNFDMDWHQHIHSHPEVLVGKPVVRGSRLSVDFILSLFAQGWTEQQILENHPTLNAESIRAVFAFAAECTRDEALKMPHCGLRAPIPASKWPL